MLRKVHPTRPYYYAAQILIALTMIDAPEGLALELFEETRILRKDS